MLVAVVARASNVDTFGAFSLAYIIYGLSLGAGRAAGGEILLLRAAQGGEGPESDEGNLLGLTVALSVLAALVTAMVALVLEGASRSVVLVLAAAAPALLIQDALRYCFFALGRPSDAIRIDLIWATVQALGFLVLIALLTSPDPHVFVLVWALGAAASAIVGLFQLRVAPRPVGAMDWIRDERERAFSFLSDFILIVGVVYVSIYAVGLVAGLATVAAIRGAQLLFRPFDVFVSGLRIVTLPALARTSARDTTAIVSKARQLSALLLIPALVWSATMIALPDAVGRAVLGDTWQVAKPLLLPVAAAAIARTVALPSVDGIRALGGGRRLVVRRLVTSFLILTGTVLGAVVADAGGAANGLALALVVSAVIWWIGLLHASRDGPTTARVGIKSQKAR